MQVKLVKIGNNKIELIKLIRWVTSLSLKEAYDKVNNIPSAITLKGDNINFEQIKNNFSSIGAQIEINTEKKPDAPVGGVTNIIKEEKIVENNEIEIEHSTKITDKNKPTEVFKEDFFKLINNKADTYAIVRAIKSSLTFSIIGALAYSISSFYFNYYFGYIIIFIVALANAIILKKETNSENTSIAKIAAGMTFFFYLASIYFNSLVLSFLYQTIIGSRGFLFGFLNVNFAFILIAMTISYYLVAKKSPIDAFVKTKKAKTFDKGKAYTSKSKRPKRKKKKF